MPDKTAQNGMTNGQSLQEADREALDARALAGEAIPAATLMAILTSPQPPTGITLQRYAEQLLAHTLETRNPESAVLITRLMDADPELDEKLHETLNEWLQTEPDAVYAVIRARMAEDPSERWLFRLKVAALCALHVAITDGDSETAINWLRLVSREPTSYELSELFHHGLLAAAERAHNDGTLGRLLIPLAARRDPGALEILLHDQALLDAIAAQYNLGHVLRDYSGDPLQTLQNHGYDMFVVAMARAARARQGGLFTPATVEQIWTTYTGAQPTNTPPKYAPETIVNAWIADGVDWLDEAALQSVLTLALRDRRDELFLALAAQLAKRDTFLKLLTNAFQRSGRAEGDIIALVAQLQTAGNVTPQDAADIYIRLMNAFDWRKSALPLVQQLSRTLQHQSSVSVNADVMWRVLQLAEEARDENVTKTIAKRLTTELEAIEDESALVESLMRLVSEVQWHAGTRQFVANWWRAYIRGSALARLQRIDKAMDGKKGLDELRAVLQTVIAFRKMLGKRTLQQFAWDVGVASGILQALNESFDPSPKRPAVFDMPTMRAELEARASELTPQEQQIMANNFKELAHLIAGMGDNRSKASLMRRGDDVDRLLMTGEQQPHSAVDTLKWLAGYLSGSQEKEETDEE